MVDITEPKPPETIIVLYRRCLKAAARNLDLCWLILEAAPPPPPMVKKQVKDRDNNFSIQFFFSFLNTAVCRMYVDELM